MNMNPNQLYKSTGFSWKKRGQSIGFALQGILLFFKKEHNAWLHGLATILVLLLSVYFRVNVYEAIALTLSIGMVWAAEIFNTSIERIMDYLSKEKHPAIKIIKDLAAAAVLVTALTALLVGAFVFIPKIIAVW